MASQQAILMGIPWRPILVSGADFDGTNDFMTTGAGLTGAADGKVGTVMLWFRLDGGDGTSMTIFQACTTVGGAVSHWRIRRESTNLISIIGNNAAGTIILSISTAATYTANATWRQLLASWNLATAAAHIYVSDVSDLTSTTLTDDSIDYTVADWAIGAQANGGTKFNGCLSEVYLALEYVDLSSSTNRAKFITGVTAKPMYLGTDGSVPTGTAAIVYQRVVAGAAVTTFATNKGTGGNFTITGTLDLASTSPSD